MKDTTPGQAFLPQFADMQFLVQTARGLYNMTPPHRAGYVLARLSAYIGATSAMAWVLDIDGRPLAAIGSSGIHPRSPVPLADDPAAVRLAELAPASQSVIQRRCDLLQDPICPSESALGEIRDAIYSRHMVSPTSNCLLAFYSSEHTGRWGSRDRNVVRLMHSQAAGAFAACLARPAPRLAPNAIGGVSPPAWPRTKPQIAIPRVEIS